MAAQIMGWTAMDECWRKGPWTAEEDRRLLDYVKQDGEGRWNSVSRLTGLRRNGKSCRLRWVNYLRPDLKRGSITPQEEKIILGLHTRWGNRWSAIARCLPGRTDNEIKNYWRTHFKKTTNTCSTSNVEKLRARLLRKQQFQLQQQLLQQQQEQEHEFSHQFDTKRITSVLEETDNQVFPMTNSPPQLTTNTTNAVNGEEQGLLYSMLKSDASNSESSNDLQTEHQQEDVLWDELWNMEDLQGNFAAFCGPSKQANFLNQFVSPFY